jgi:hypothetical protein
MKTNFLKKSIPAWYELSLVNEGIIRLKVHRDALQHMRDVDWEKAPAVRDMVKRFGFESFYVPCDGMCGFDKVFTQGGLATGTWVGWDIRLPNIRTENGEHEDSKKYTMAVRATLWLFTSCLWLYEGDTQWTKPQLMVVEGICLPTEEMRMCLGSLSVSLSPKVIRWLSKQPKNKHLEPVIDAMKNASRVMWESSSDRGGFGALVRESKWLHLDVPGNACGLDPESHDDESLDVGYTLEPHNVDSSLQQLTLLAGLAKLHDLVRADE